MMMKDQRWVADERGLPVEDIGGSSSRVSVSGETVSFYYSSTGTRTVDAGQAAGVMVEAVLAFGPIANSSGDQVGNPVNTSLSFTSTAFTREVRLSYKDLESLDRLSFAARLSALQALVTAQKTAQASGTPTPMANGDYVVDYRKGILWGLKASTQTTLTSAAYKTLQKASAVASTPSGSSSIAIAEDTAETAGEIIVKNGAVRRDSPASSAGTSGDWSTVNNDANGNAWSTLGTKISGEDQTSDVMKTQTQMAYTNISASALIKSGAGQLAGFVVNSCGAGATLKLWDNTSAATTVLLNTMTFTAAVAQGPTVVTIPGGAGKFGTGLYATIAVAAMDVTFFYN